MRYSVYPANKSVTQVEWIPNKHYAGVKALLKLTLPTILPVWLQKVIVLDYDITMLCDIRELWDIFSQFSKKQV